MSTMIYILMNDETQQICPVEASSEAEARQIIAERLGYDVSEHPVYRVETEADAQQIVSIVANALSKEGDINK